METIKEEKKAGLEQLLNSLIEKGWLPRGEDKIHSCEFDKKENKFMARYIRSGCFQVLYRSLTELCSKSSGLWQFVCENCLLAKVPGHYRSWDSNYQGRGSEDRYPEYRLIESSLKDESELEDFLLSNIKVDVESK